MGTGALEHIHECCTSFKKSIRKIYLKGMGYTHKEKLINYCHFLPHPDVVKNDPWKFSGLAKVGFSIPARA